MDGGERHWSEIAPKDAVNIVLPREDIVGPVNEGGEPCSWPWEPQQRVGWPMGMYRCGYCDMMVVAGVPHGDFVDARDVSEEPSSV